MTECHCPACGCIHELGCTPLAAAEALSRLTAASLPGRVKEAIYLVKQAAIDTLFNGAGEIINPELLDDTARRILALAAPSSPLPEEIAELIERAEAQAMSRWGGPNNEHKNSLEWHLAAALQRLAQEVERLIYVTHATKEIQEERNEMAARIAELEAELATWKDIAVTIEKARDAIRTKTIEDCMTVKATIPQKAFAAGERAYLEGFQDGAAAQVDSIRALNQPEADGGE